MRRTLQAVVLAVGVLWGQASVAAAAELPPLRHGYVDNRYGQLHYSIAQPKRATALPPIVLLHQSPNSSAEFEKLVAVLGKDRVAIGIDTPGYGGSDGPATQPVLEDYVTAIAEGLKNMGYGPGKPVDVFGYHTGSKIGVELAVTEPKLVRRLALSGIYDPPPETITAALARLHHPESAYDLIKRLGANLDATKQRYEKMGLTDAQWGRIRIDSLRGMTRQEFGHEAAFRYTHKFTPRMRMVKQPVLLLPMDDGLAQATKDAAKHFKQVTTTDRVFTAGAFFTETDAVAAALNAFSGEKR